MQINAINSMNTQGMQSFGKKQKVDPHYNNPEGTWQLTPEDKESASKKASKSLRNAALGLMMAASAMGGMTSLSSCTVDDDSPINIDIDIKNKINIFAVPSKPDTVHIHHTDTIHSTDTLRDTTYIHIFDSIPIYIEKDYYCPAGDSIIAHQKVVDGPIEGGGKNPMPIRFGGFDPYNQAMHDLKFVREESSPDKMVFIDKMTVYMKDPENPETKWAKYEYSVADGKGLYVQKYKPKSDNGIKPEKWGWQPNGEVIETNHGKRVTISSIDANGTLEYKGNYEKGKQSGSIFLTTVLAGTNPPQEDYQEITNMFMQIQGTNENDNKHNPSFEIDKDKQQ